MVARCRFTRCSCAAEERSFEMPKIVGTRELTITNRGSRNEIDVFPGFPLDNPLQGNVVDICPVGSMLDKEFLFSRRVWELKGTSSICPGCAVGSVGRRRLHSLAISSPATAAYVSPNALRTHRPRSTGRMGLAT